MAAIIAAALLHQEERIPRNYFRNRPPVFEISERRFRKMFRLDKESVLYLFQEIAPYLPSSRIPLHIRVLSALSFFASGSYQDVVGRDEYIALSQPSVSRCIKSVSKTISMHLLKDFIKFPTLNEDLAILKQKFYLSSGFPGIIGAIDCTHVAIVPPPSLQGIAYFNRKLYWSINVQLIADPDTLIYGISARYPGSVHDSFIWKYSKAREHLLQMDKGWLVGDSGYPQELCLMTPFANPLPGSVEECYNHKHASARACIERCNGVLKARFRCLLKDRVLHYSPTAACHIINACAVLHNICVQRNVPLDEDIVQDDDDMPPTEPPSSDNNSRARNLRYRIALSIFD